MANSFMVIQDGQVATTYEPVMRGNYLLIREVLVSESLIESAFHADNDEAW